MELQLINPLAAQLTHRAFPEVADALRAVADQITHAWDIAVRKAMPQMRHLSFDELRDSTPEILIAIADAMGSADPSLIEALVRRAPLQGLSRLELKFDVIEVMQEDRLLRAITVIHVEAELGRRMDELESAALHSAIDLMLQRSVIALVEKQKGHLRAAAETELKYLSFLSHDMNNILACIKMRLEVLRIDLCNSGMFPQAEESLTASQRSIDDTVKGMRQMLDHERLRKSAKPPARLPVDLHAIAKLVVIQLARAAKAKNVNLSVEVPPGTTLDSDGELLTLILQNLVGNAIKYSTAGTVRIGMDDTDNPDRDGRPHSNGKPHGQHQTDSTDDGPAGARVARRVLWVSDEGAGIATDKLGAIFNAFERGEVHGQQGLGLGLAIASQAAKLMGTELTVVSKPGEGSTFRLLLPDYDNHAGADKGVGG